MKRILACLLAVMMLCSMTLVANAEIPNETVDALQFTTAPKLDGVITEAEWGKPTVHVIDAQATTEYVDSKGVEEAEENIWFDLWIRWDANNYYIGMYLPDTTHTLAASESSLWNGDVVQMGFDPQGPIASGDYMDPWSDEYTNMSFGLVTGEGNTLSSWAWSGPCESSQVDGAKYNIKHANGFTTYEIAIPWASIGVEGGVKAGDVFGATIARVLADYEDDGYNGWLSWGTGILGRNSTAEEDACGSNAIRLSATAATAGAAAPAAPSAPATSTPTAPVTADPITLVAVAMAVSAGAALSLKKRR